MLEVVTSGSQVLFVAVLFRFVRSYAVGDTSVVGIERVQIRWTAFLRSRFTVAGLRIKRVHRNVLLTFRPSSFGSLVHR